MSDQKLEGLWLGGEISREAASEVAEAVRDRAAHYHQSGKAKAELWDLANAIEAQIQKLPPPPKPVCDLI